MSGVTLHGYALAVVVILHLLIGTAYSVLIPAWEAPDEPSHADYVFFVARYKALPSLKGIPTSELTGKEFSQPPIYYILGAIPVAVLGTDTTHNLVKNPYIWAGGGVNYAVHDPLTEKFPWRGAILSLHLVRLVSVLVSALGVIVTYLLGKLLWDDEWLSLLAASIFAFWPEFLFMGSVVNNDVLIAVLGSYVAFVGVRVLVGSPRRGDLWLLWGLTLVSFFVKYLALAFVPFVAVVSVAAVTTNWHFWKSHWQALTALAGALLLILAFWFGYNLKTTGVLVPRDPYALLLLAKKLKDPGQTVSMVALIPRTVYHGFYSFWGVFGWCSISAPRWTFRLFGGLGIVGSAGLLVSFVRARAKERWLILLLLFFLVCVLTLPMLREISYGKTSLCGRYMLSALTAFSILLVWGFKTFLPSVTSRRVAAVAAVIVMGGVSLYILLETIVPAYAAPKIYEYAVPQRPQETEVHARFGDGIELVSYQLWPQTVKPGHAVGVTAVWRCLKPMGENYTLGLQILGRDMAVYGERYLYPGHGKFPTSMWKPGDTFREVYWIPPTRPGPLPSLGQVQISFFLDEGVGKWTPLPVADASGRPVGGSLIVGRLKLAAGFPAGAGAAPEYPTAYRFDDHISLAGYTLEGAPVAGDRLNLTLFWRADGRPSARYTAFVHLLDANGDQVLGADTPPGGIYYPADIWDAGDVVTSTHSLALPVGLPGGRYTVEVGLYRSDDGSRLAVSSPEGAQIPRGAVPLTRVRVKGLPERLLLPLVGR